VEVTKPRWLTIAESHIGTREIAGPKHNAKIIGWLQKLKSWIKDDETPWCGTFCAAVMQEAGLPYPKEFPRAKAWSDYGANLRTSHVAPGAILVFSRDGGGHVGFYVGEDVTAYHVLGGNQSNAVNVTRILKNRCIAIRWPRGEAVVGGPVRLAANGTVSRNEA
jgi:uncharacterized protein (TIGR02594 family)